MPVTGTLTPDSVRQYILVGGAGWHYSNSVRQYTVDGVKVDKVDVDKEEVSLRCQFAVIDLTPPHTDTQQPVR